MVGEGSHINSEARISTVRLKWELMQRCLSVYWFGRFDMIIGVYK